LAFGKTEIFFPSGLDRAEAQAVADLPVGLASLSLTPVADDDDCCDRAKFYLEAPFF
jgi:hypothetical protein